MINFLRLVNCPTQDNNPEKAFFYIRNDSNLTSNLCLNLLYRFYYLLLFSFAWYVPA